MYRWPSEVERHHLRGPGSIARRVSHRGALRVAWAFRGRMEPSDSAVAAICSLAFKHDAVAVWYRAPRRAAFALLRDDLCDLAIGIPSAAAPAALSARAVAWSHDFDGGAWWVPAHDAAWGRLISRRLIARTMLLWLTGPVAGVSRMF